MKKKNNILFLVLLIMLSACGDEKSASATSTEPEVEEVIERVCDRTDQTGVYTATATPINATCVVTPFQIALTDGDMDFGPGCATTTEFLENDCRLNTDLACADSTSDLRVTGNVSVTQTDDDGDAFHGTFNIILEDISVTPTVVLCEGEYYFSLLR
tara:strand:- start:6578 stop:7048 length:471 start_codon:yes stop_codon:yes gene_type:complete